MNDQMQRNGALSAGLSSSKIMTTQAIEGMVEKIEDLNNAINSLEAVLNLVLIPTSPTNEDKIPGSIYVENELTRRISSCADRIDQMTFNVNDIINRVMI